MKRKMFKRILVLTGTAVMLLASTSLLTSCDSFEAEPLPIPENQLQPIKDKSIEELEDIKLLPTTVRQNKRKLPPYCLPQKRRFKRQLQKRIF